MVGLEFIFKTDLEHTFHSRKFSIADMSNILGVLFCYVMLFCFCDNIDRDYLFFIFC